MLGVNRFLPFEPRFVTDQPKKCSKFSLFLITAQQYNKSISQKTTNYVEKQQKFFLKFSF